MYPIHEEYREKLIKALSENAPQSVTIKVDGLYESCLLTDKDIIAGTFLVDRYCTSGDKLEIGSAIAAELKVTLNNSDGRFDNFTFEGAKLYAAAQIRPKDFLGQEAFSYEIPLGYFTVDEQPRKLSTISLSALDRMVWFDKPYDSSLAYPATLVNILENACENCNVTLGTDARELFGCTCPVPGEHEDSCNYPFYADYRVASRPEEDKLTYRQMIAWIAGMTGTCAYIDWEGKLRFSWYRDTEMVLTPADRYSSSMGESEITVTGVMVTDQEKQTYSAGDTGYELLVEGNLLATQEHQALAEAIYRRVGAGLVLSI